MRSDWIAEPIIERARALLTPESREAADLIAYLHRSRDELDRMQQQMTAERHALEEERAKLRTEGWRGSRDASRNSKTNCRDAEALRRERGASSRGVKSANCADRWRNPHGARCRMCAAKRGRTERGTGADAVGFANGSRDVCEHGSDQQ